MTQFALRIKSYFPVFTLIFILSLVANGQSKIQKQFDKAQQYYRANNIYRAITEAKKIIEKDPGFVNAALFLADIYHDTDSVRQEIEFLEIALQYSDNNGILYRLG